MKQVVLQAEFPNITLQQIKEDLFDDISFQHGVQTQQGHKNVNIGEWRTVFNDGNTLVKTREISFESPVDASPAIRKFVGMDFTLCQTTATMTVFGRNLNQPQHAMIQRMEVETVMTVKSGALKDSLIVTIKWIAMPRQTDPRTTDLQQQITSEFKGWVPLIGSKIENTSLTSAQKSFDNWVANAKQRCTPA